MTSRAQRVHGEWRATGTWRSGEPLAARRTHQVSVSCWRPLVAAGQDDDAARGVVVRTPWCGRGAGSGLRGSEIRHAPACAVRIAGQSSWAGAMIRRKPPKSIGLPMQPRRRASAWAKARAIRTVARSQSTLGRERGPGSDTSAGNPATRTEE
jgi:hypothetical protein